MKKLSLMALTLASLLAAAAPAQANTQVIDATITSTLSMDTKPTAAISGWSLASTGANTTSGGSIGINANQAYTVTVTADKTRMTEYVTATSSYVATTPKSLASPLSVVTARTGGTAATPGVAATAVVGTSTTLATGTGLGTDTYSVTLSQPTTIADPALPSGRTYHIVLTYTAASTL